MTDNARIPTNLRILRILELLSAANGAMTPTAISRELGMAKPTVHRLCKTLLEERYLVQEGASKHVWPGRRARSIASGLLFNSWQHAARHQILMDVARQVGETVNFVVPEDKGMFYLDRVETDWPFQVKLPIGSHVPFHCTASGKAYLASLSTRSRAAMVGALSLAAHTSNTHVSTESLLRDIETIRRNGYAIDNEEFVDGMVAIAVPVKDSKARYIASLAFHGPVQRVSVEMAVSRKNVLLDASAKLSAALFGG